MNDEMFDMKEIISIYWNQETFFSAFQLFSLCYEQDRKDDQPVAIYISSS